MPIAVYLGSSVAQANWLDTSQQMAGIVLHSSDKPSELSQ